MISLEQWRSATGVFSSTHPPLIRMNWNAVQEEETISTTSGYAIATVGLLLSNNSLIFITAILLICSGDVELNPGPVNCKKCPSCQLATAPVKLKVCRCGHIFRKKSHRQPPKCCLFPVTTSQPATSHSEAVSKREGTTVTSPFAIHKQSQPVVGKPPTTEGTADVTPTKGYDIATPADSSDTEMSTVVVRDIKAKTLSPAQLQSLPVRTSTPEDNYVVTPELVNNEANNHKPVIPPKSQPVLPQSQPVLSPESQPVIGQSSTSQQKKWENYKNSINKARRQKYRSNPTPVKERVRQAYSLDPSPVRAMKREKYRCNPSPVRASKREKYRSHPTPVKERVRQAYSLNPSPVRAMKREKYRSNPTPVKERVRLAYSLNPSPVRACKRAKYRDNPSPFKERARATYRLNPSLKRIRSTVAYRNDHEGIKFKRRLT